jgi:sugar phosphate isomerase/epimerase
MLLILSVCLFVSGCLILVLLFWQYSLYRSAGLILSGSLSAADRLQRESRLEEVQNRLNLGISTGIFYEKDILETLPFIREAGFQTVEIWAGPQKNGEYIHFNWHEPYRVQALAVFLRTLGMRVNSLHAPFSERIDVCSLSELQRRQAVNEVLRSLEVLKQLNGEYLVLHPASNESSMRDRDAHFRQARKSIEEIYRCMEGMGVKLAVENQLPHILGGDIGTLLALIEGLPSSEVGICFDTSHANLYRGQAVEDSFLKLSSRVMTLHISDNYGNNDDHFVVGDGHINWNSFVGALIRNDYHGVFLMEITAAALQKDKYIVLKSGYTRAAELLKTGFAIG